MKRVNATTELNVSAVLHQMDIDESDEFKRRQGTTLIESPLSNVARIARHLESTGWYIGLTMDEVEVMALQGLVFSPTNKGYLECSICIRRGKKDAFGTVKRIRDHFRT